MLCEEAGTQPGDPSIKDGIAELASFSMATRDGARFTVHRMVQDALRSRIPEERRRDWIERSLWLVNEFSPYDPDDVRTWPVWDRLRPHAALVVKYADGAGIAHPTARLMAELATLLNAKALHIEAEPLMRRALEIYENFYGPQHPNVATCLSNLARLLQDTNRFIEAEPLMRRSLQIKEKSFGSNHPEVATGLNNLATLLKDTNRLSDAEPLMRRALQINEDSFGPQHPNVAIRLNNLAQLLQATNRLADAEPLMRRALQIDEQSFGPQHPNVAIRLNNLATVASGYQPVGGRRASDAARSPDRRAILRTSTPKRRQRPQQSGSVASGHQPISGCRASDAAGGGDFRAKPGVRPSEHQNLSQQFNLVAPGDRLPIRAALQPRRGAGIKPGVSTPGKRRDQIPQVPKGRRVVSNGFLRPFRALGIGVMPGPWG